MRKRRYKRYIRRLETEFTIGGSTFRGISSDLSEKGLFIRTGKGFVPGSILDIVIYLPNGEKAKVKGIVRRTIKTDSTLVKNGMGIEILENDEVYTKFIKDLTGGDFIIVTCHNCKIKNKVPAEKLSMGPKCGNCKEPLRV
jgi:hypothetical protein